MKVETFEDVCMMVNWLNDNIHFPVTDSQRSKYMSLVTNTMVKRDITDTDLLGDISIHRIDGSRSIEVIIGESTYNIGSRGKVEEVK